MKNITSISFRERASIHILLLFLLSFGAINAQVSSSIDTTEISIGEEIIYKIEVVADTTDLVIFAEGQTFLPLEVIESYKIDTTYEANKIRLIKKFGLTQFDSGAYTIPGQKLNINDLILSTDSIQVHVNDVAVDTLKQPMFEIKTAFDVDRPPFQFIKLLYWLIPLLLIGGLLYYFFRRKKKKLAAEKQLPPYEEAMEALQELDSSSLLLENNSKAYYSALTEIVKRYIDREVDETALESTSNELIERLQLHKDAGHFDFDTDTIKKLNTIFKRADLIKFAKMKEESNQATVDRTIIEDIINETKEVIPEPTEEELLLNEEYLRKKRLQRRNKRIIIGIVSGIFLIFLTTGIFASIYGLAYVKDNIIGHPSKELLEGRWVKSEYGIPAVGIETPKVLERREVDLPEEAKQMMRQNDMFAYGSYVDEFYVFVNTVLYQDGIETDLNKAAEAGLQGLEQNGATNLIVKQESFETEEGLEGLKLFGSMNQVLANGKTASYDSEYEIYLFKQSQAFQSVMVIYRSDDAYGVEIKDRIVNSIEVEVQQSQQPKQEQ